MFPAHFVFDQFQQCYVGCPETRGISDKRAAGCAAGKLAYPAGNQVDQYVGVTNLLQSFSTQFRVQLLPLCCCDNQ